MVLLEDFVGWLETQGQVHVIAHQHGSEWIRGRGSLVSGVDRKDHEKHNYQWTFLCARHCSCALHNTNLFIPHASPLKYGLLSRFHRQGHWGLRVNTLPKITHLVRAELWFWSSWSRVYTLPTVLSVLKKVGLAGPCKLKGICTDSVWETIPLEVYEWKQVCMGSLRPPLGLMIH